MVKITDGYERDLIPEGEYPVEFKEVLAQKTDKNGKRYRQHV